MPGHLPWRLCLKLCIAGFPLADLRGGLLLKLPGLLVPIRGQRF